MADTGHSPGGRSCSAHAPHGVVSHRLRCPHVWVSLYHPMDVHTAMPTSRCMNTELNFEPTPGPAILSGDVSRRRARNSSARRRRQRSKTTPRTNVIQTRATAPPVVNFPAIRPAPAKAKRQPATSIQSRPGRACHGSAISCTIAMHIARVAPAIPTVLGIVGIAGDRPGESSQAVRGAGAAVTSGAGLWRPRRSLRNARRPRAVQSGWSSRN